MAAANMEAQAMMPRAPPGCGADSDGARSYLRNTAAGVVSGDASIGAHAIPDIVYLEPAAVPGERARDIQSSRAVLHRHAPVPSRGISHPGHYGASRGCELPLEIDSGTGGVLRRRPWDHRQSRGKNRCAATGREGKRLPRGIP